MAPPPGEGPVTLTVRGPAGSVDLKLGGDTDAADIESLLRLIGARPEH